MKIRTNLASSELVRIAREVGVTFSRWETSGSRTHAATHDIVLSGSGKRRNCEGDKGAHWDEWGNFLGRIYLVDPSTTSSVYRNADHFAWSTANRYAGGVVSGEACDDHKWQYDGASPGGAYSVHSCTKCGALRRFGTPAYVRENFLS